MEDNRLILSAFRAGQTVYWLKSGEIREVVVTRVIAESRIQQGNLIEEVRYKTNKSYQYDVIRCTDLFKTKQEAGIAMLEANGLDLGLEIV